MHTEEYRKFSYTATYTALHIYMKTQSRGTHPCVLFIWLSKESSVFTSVYLYGCPRSVEGICMYVQVCLFRVCCCVYVKTCIYCAHLCRCIDVHVLVTFFYWSKHVSMYTSAAAFWVHTHCYFHVDNLQSYTSSCSMCMCIHAKGIEGICMQKYTYAKYLFMLKKISMSEVRSYAHA